TDENGLEVIDTATLMVTSTTPLKTALQGGFPTQVAVSPDGGRLVINNGEAQGKAQEPAAVVVDTLSLTLVAQIPRFGGDNPHDVAVATPPSGLCAGDSHAQTRVTVGELVTAVDYSVDGCPTARNSPPVAASN